MGLYYYSPCETSVVLTADYIVGRDDGLLEQQRQDSYVCRTNRTVPRNEEMCDCPQHSLSKKIMKYGQFL